MDSAQKVITDQLKMVLSNQEQVSTDTDDSLDDKNRGGHVMCPDWWTESVRGALIRKE